MSARTTRWSALPREEVAGALTSAMGSPVGDLFRPQSALVCVDGTVSEDGASLHGLMASRHLRNPFAPVMRVRFASRNGGTEITYRFSLSRVALVAGALGLSVLAAAGFATIEAGIGPYVALALGSSLVMACTAAYVFGIQQKRDLAEFLVRVAAAERVPRAARPTS